MKKCLCIFMALFLCILLTGCDSSLPKLYQDFALECINGIGEMTLDEVKALAENKGYEFDDWSADTYHISTKNGNEYVNVRIQDDVIFSVNFFNKKHNTYIDINPYEITCVNLSSPKAEHFDSLAEGEEYMFADVSGVDFTTKEKIQINIIDATPRSDSNTLKSFTLLHGDLLDEKDTSGTLVIKAKVSSSYNNKATVDQNYYNIEDIIKNQGGDKYTEIQYWAVADMTDGSEQNVVSFTVSESVIKKIADNKIVANQMGSYVDDLFIHASLS